MRKFFKRHVTTELQRQPKWRKWQNINIHLQFLQLLDFLAHVITFFFYYYLFSYKYLWSTSLLFAQVRLFLYLLFKKYIYFPAPVSVVQLSIQIIITIILQFTFRAMRPDFILRRWFQYVNIGQNISAIGLTLT